MTLRDDIQAVRSRTDLTAKQKRVAIHRIKSNALADHAANLVGRSFNEGEYRITITKAPAVVEGRLLVWVSAKKNGQDVPIPEAALPFIFVNPPVSVREVDPNLPASARTDSPMQPGPLPVANENPLAALRRMVADAVAMFG